MKIKSVRELTNLKNKKVLLRLDLNVPIAKNKVLDTYKIEAVIKTIDFLMKKNASLIICSHLGKPRGKADKDLSLKIVSQALSKISGRKIKFIPEVVGKEVEKEIKEMKSGEIVCLENLRFEAGELKDEAKFAKDLASLADIYVNDALAVSHRKQASVSAIKKYLPSYAGLLLESELKAFKRVMSPKKPLVIIIGGAKIETKLPIIANLYTKSTTILLGGGLANSFLKYRKHEIGKSLFEKDSIFEIKKLLKGRKDLKKIVIPSDVIVKNRSGKVLAKDIEKVLKSDTILDIGPKTISVYAMHVKKAQTLVWNGPMGKFEEKDFSAGTMAMARLIASRSSGRAYGVVGGGETVAALKASYMMEHVDWVSTAGGAMLSYLGAKSMPGLSGIVS